MLFCYPNRLCQPDAYQSQSEWHYYWISLLVVFGYLLLLRLACLVLLV